MRDRETIDAELRRLREQGGQLSSRRVDELLDERLGHAHETEVVADARQRPDQPGEATPYRRRGVLRLIGPVTLPLSLVAVAAVSVAMFAVHKPHPDAQPGADPPSSEAQPNPAAPQVQAPSKPQAPPLDIADKVFIDGLNRVGVPVPSHEYAMAHGHAVCDFLTHHSNYAEAVRFVQRSSEWDAKQSADFTADAIVSYCPQSTPTGPDDMQPALQNALSNLQAIERDLHGIEGNLHGIHDGLQGVLGQQ